VSGTGVVAEGCVFTDGSVALRWRGTNPATAVWPDLESILAVHGHQGATEVRWLEGEDSPADRDTWPEPGEVELEHLFDGQHNVRPPSSLSDPSALPPSRARGWAGARHLR
jgi:hypothetical protein